MGFSRQEYWSVLPLPSPPMYWVGQILSDSMNLTILGTSYKWNQTVFVCTYCIVKCIFINLISWTGNSCLFLCVLKKHNWIHWMQCYGLLFCTWVLNHFSCVQLLCNPMGLAMLLCPWNSPGQNTGTSPPCCAYISLHLILRCGLTMHPGKK